MFFLSRGLNENGFYPEDLYEIEQTIVDNNRCYAEWGGDITGRMLCANVENQIDSCSGNAYNFLKTCKLNFSLFYFLGDSGRKVILLLKSLLSKEYFRGCCD